MATRAINLIPGSTGVTLRVGDEVEVLEQFETGRGRMRS
jgi:hypothetical protein